MNNKMPIQKLFLKLCIISLLLGVVVVHSAWAIDKRSDEENIDQISSEELAALDLRKPEEIIEQTSTEVLRVINEDYDDLKDNPALINDLINNTIIPIIDLKSMGKLILGKHWKNSSEEQRALFVTEFKDMLIRTYAKSIVDFGHAKVSVLPHEPTQQSKFKTVKTELSIGSGKAPLQVTYVFRSNKQNEWKVFDLRVDGLSLVKNFRTSFSQEIKETSLDALIERLANTNRTGEIDEFASE